MDTKCIMSSDQLLPRIKKALVLVAIFLALIPIMEPAVLKQKKNFDECLYCERHVDKSD